MGGHWDAGVFEVLGAENSKNDVVDLWEGGGQFNDTVFEVLGAENSKNDVVQLWRGWGGHGGQELTKDAGEFNDTPKNDVESIWLRGVIASTSPWPNG